jgi:ACS family sodium-dependent inorganic phosphate cotransporter
MTEMFSAKWVVWASVFINVVFILLTSVALISYITVLVFRFIEGFGAVRSVTNNRIVSIHQF